MKKGSLKEAGRVFRKAIGLRKDYLEAQEGLGLCLWQSFSIIEKEHNRAMSRQGFTSYGHGTLETGLQLLDDAREALQYAVDLGSKRKDVLGALEKLSPPESPPSEATHDSAEETDTEGKSPFALFSAGQFHLQMGEYEEAANLIEQALGKKPERVHIGYWKTELGAAYIGLKRYKEAIDEIKGAKDQEGASNQPWYASAWYNLGTAHYRRGDCKDAMDAFKRFLELEPDSGEAESLKRSFPELRTE